jgi:hypothetical protein
MYKSYPQKVENLLDGRLRNYKIDERVKAAEALNIWEKVLTAIFPEAVGKTMATGFHNGVLTVAVLSRELVDVIITLQSRILYELNARLGKVLVYRVQCEC